MKLKRGLLIIGAMLLLLLIMGINVEAASFDASISTTSVTEGDTFTVTVRALEAAGTYTVSANNSNATITSGNATDFLDNSSATITYKAISAGSVTITANATDMSDSNDDSIAVTGSKSFTVTIKAKETTPAPTEPTTPSTPAEPTFTSTNQTVYSTGTINLRSSWSTSSSAVSIPAGTELKLTGTSTQTINGYVWYRVEYNGQTKYVSRSLVTSTKPATTQEPTTTTPEEPEEKSTNSNLGSLRLDLSGLTPDFSKDVKEYSITIGSDIDKLDITATAEDDKASVSVTGNSGFEIGENTVRITVTAEDGTTTVYAITVNKVEKEQLKLATLEIEGLELTPGFNSSVYEYTVNITETSALKINAIASDEGATVEIIGNTEFTEDENLITIIITSADGTETATYQINVVKEAPVVTVTYENNNIIMYAIIGVAILFVIILIIFLIKRRKNKSISDEYYTETYVPRAKYSDLDPDTSIDVVKKEPKPSVEDDFDDDDDDRPRRRGKHF